MNKDCGNGFHQVESRTHPNWKVQSHESGNYWKYFVPSILPLEAGDWRFSVASTSLARGNSP